MDSHRFRTRDGNPVTAVTANEMREVDRVAVEEFGIELLQMMENAGRNLAEQARSLEAETVTIVAGNGGNGGGGLCCARHLANREAPVSVVLDRQPDDLDGAARQQYEILDAMGVPVRTGADAVDATGTDLVVDALVGYGLDGPLRETAVEMVDVMDAIDASVVSLDVPSGIDATTGEQHGTAVDPSQVVTLALPKTGLASLDCPVVLADISVPAGVYDRLDIPYDRPFTDEYVIELARSDQSRAEN